MFAAVLAILLVFVVGVVVFAGCSSFVVFAVGVFVFVAVASVVVFVLVVGGVLLLVFVGGVGVAGVACNAVFICCLCCQ